MSRTIPTKKELICLDASELEHRLTREGRYTLEPGFEQSKPGLARIRDDHGKLGFFLMDRFYDPSVWLCVDCTSNTLHSPKDYYMVTDEVWQQYGLGAASGMLCVDCLENRIGHPLQAEQLLPCALNERINPYTREIFQNAVLIQAETVGLLPAGTTNRL